MPARTPSSLVSLVPLPPTPLPPSTGGEGSCQRNENGINRRHEVSSAHPRPLSPRVQGERGVPNGRGTCDVKTALPGRVRASLQALDERLDEEKIAPGY